MAGVRHYDGGISAAAAVGSSQPVAHTAGLQQKLRQPGVRCWMRRLLRMPAVPEYQKAGSYCTATCVPTLRHRLTSPAGNLVAPMPHGVVAVPHTLRVAAAVIEAGFECRPLAAAELAASRRRLCSGAFRYREWRMRSP